MHERRKSLGNQADGYGGGRQSSQPCSLDQTALPQPPEQAENRISGYGVKKFPISVRKTERGSSPHSHHKHCGDRKKNSLPPAWLRSLCQPAERQSAQNSSRSQSDLRIRHILGSHDRIKKYCAPAPYHQEQTERIPAFKTHSHFAENDARPRKK